MPIDVLIHSVRGNNHDRQLLIQRAISTIASDYGWEDGQVSVAIVDDETIHAMNRQYLEHDYPTDVLSFDLTDREDFIEGEIIASLDTAERVAAENDWHPFQELLLYIVHGMLHIVGLQDSSPAQSRRMRAEERHYLEVLTGDASHCELPKKKQSASASLAKRKPTK